MLMRQISTIKSHDRRKRGYFGNHKVISYHLQLSRGAKPPRQLFLYLLNDINSLCEFTKGPWRLGTSSLLQMIADDLVIAKIPLFSMVITFDG